MMKIEPGSYEMKKFLFENGVISRIDLIMKYHEVTRAEAIEIAKRVTVDNNEYR